MGSEDLFHKRKARKAEETARKKGKIKPYDRVLIVCEGEKTEPIYFEEIRVTLELDSANIKVEHLLSNINLHWSALKILFTVCLHNTEINVCFRFSLLQLSLRSPQLTCRPRWKINILRHNPAALLSLTLIRPVSILNVSKGLFQN